jgi:hypothetical protein
MSLDTVSNTETNINTSEVQQNKKSNRSFKVKLGSDGEPYGRYNGNSPYQAANKALSEIFRNKAKSGEQTGGDVNFFLIESTKNSAKKQHQYVGRQITLDTPIEYSVGNGVTILKKHKNFLRKVKTDTLTVETPNNVVQ